MLGSVAALFATFVFIQFQYFFGGQANIQIDGYTYSEYARRGFGELVTVAFFSLLLILIASGITRRETETQRRVFSGLGIGIVALVLVMLVSAFQRLVLYEAAYGFSRLRTYTHVFMLWLAAVTGCGGRTGNPASRAPFALAALIASLGFALSLGIMNVDGFIVRQNVDRAVQGEAFDASYLTGLSTDAFPRWLPRIRLSLYLLPLKRVWVRPWPVTLQTRTAATILYPGNPSIFPARTQYEFWHRLNPNWTSISNRRFGLE